MRKHTNLLSLFRSGTLQDIIGCGYSQPDHISNLPISDVIKAIFSRKFRESLANRLQKQTKDLQTADCEKAVKAINSATTRLLKEIVHHCPEDHLIRIKLTCGATTDKYLEEILQEQIFVASKEGTAYTSGTGCMMINPDHFDRDSNLIAAWIFDSRFLSGYPICFFDYHEKKIIK